MYVYNKALCSIFSCSIGAGSLSSLASVGTLSYWVKLQTPITQSNRQDSELVIRIIKCTNLPSSVQGTL